MLVLSSFWVYVSACIEWKLMGAALWESQGGCATILGCRIPPVSNDWPWLDFMRGPVQKYECFHPFRVYHSCLVEWLGMAGLYVGHQRGV